MSQLVRLEGKHTYQNAHCALVPPGFFTKLTTPHATRPGCAKTLGRASHLLEAKTTKSASSRLAFMDNLSLCARTLLEDQKCDVLHLHAL